MKDVTVFVAIRTLWSWWGTILCADPPVIPIGAVAGYVTEIEKRVYHK